MVLAVSIINKIWPCLMCDVVGLSGLAFYNCGHLWSFDAVISASWKTITGCLCLSFSKILPDTSISYRLVRYFFVSMELFDGFVLRTSTVRGGTVASNPHSFFNPVQHHLNKKNQRLSINWSKISFHRWNGGVNGGWNIFWLSSNSIHASHFLMKVIAE